MNETAMNPMLENQDDAAYEKQVDLTMNQVKVLQQQMMDERQETLQLQAETRAILDDVMATLRTM